MKVKFVLNKARTVDGRGYEAGDVIMEGSTPFADPTKVVLCLSQGYVDMITTPIVTDPKAEKKRGPGRPRKTN